MPTEIMFGITFFSQRYTSSVITNVADFVCHEEEKRIHRQINRICVSPFDLFNVLERYYSRVRLNEAFGLTGVIKINKYIDSSKG